MSANITTRRGASATLWLGAMGVVFALLGACGGGGGGGGGGGDGDAGNGGSEATIASQRDLAQCAQQPTTSDVYDIDSYHACGDEAGDLTGLWMVVADYQVTSTLGGSYEGQWRMAMRILVEDGQLYAHTCKGVAFSPGHEIVTAIEEGAGSFTVVDPMSNAAVRLSVVDALHLEGEHEAPASVLPLPGGTSVIRSVVSARKLTDDTALAFGGLDIDYRIQDLAYGEVQGQASNAPVICMVQSLGESVEPGGSIPYSERTNVVARLGTANAPVLVSVAAGEAKPRPGETEPDFDFSGVEVYVGQSALVGSNDPDLHEFEYLSNTRDAIELVSTVDDGEEPNSVANTASALAF